MGFGGWWPASGRISWKCSGCLILLALPTAQGLAAGRGWGGGLQIPRGPPAFPVEVGGPIPCFCPARRPSAAFPLLSAHRRPSLVADRSGLTLQGTLASACVCCDHLMGTGDTGAWNRGGQCALVVAHVPCSSGFGSPRRPGRRGVCGSTTGGRVRAAGGPPSRSLCPQCGLDILDCSQSPLALPSCAPQVQSQSPRPHCLGHLGPPPGAGSS